MSNDRTRFNTSVVDDSHMFEVRCEEASKRISDLSKTAGPPIDGYMYTHPINGYMYTHPMDGTKFGEDQPTTRAPNFGESRIFNKQCEDMIERMSKLAAELNSNNGKVAIEDRKFEDDQPTSRAPDFSESRLFNKQCENITKIHQNYMHMCKETTNKNIPQELLDVMKK